MARILIILVNVAEMPNPCKWFGAVQSHKSAYTGSGL